jgi:hypothetical protein
MKKLIPIFLACLLTGLFTSCDKIDPTPPSDPVPRECEKYHTARVQFKNRSASNKTMSIIWDGSTIATLSPFQDSQFFTVSSGKHTLAFKISNSGSNGCSQSTPVIVECQDREFMCTY